MVKIKHFTLFVIAILAFLFTGCSGSSSSITAGNQVPDQNNSPLVRLSETSSIPSGVGILGSYELSLIPGIASAELVPIRLAAIGESYIVDGASFFTMVPCSDCLKIKSIELTPESFIKLKFYIRHPFRPGDQYQPPSAKNRLDLDVFDVALLVNPVEQTPSAYNLLGVAAYTGFMVDNAGYTTELAEVTSDSAALPYVLVVDDSKTGTSTFNKFAMGTESAFEATFNPTQPLNFKLYLTMGYGASAKKAQRLNPTYYNPEFNRKSAWKVVVTPPEGNNPPAMGNTWNDSDSTTLFPVRVEVFDWQVGATVNPELTNPTDIYAASGVSKVAVEIPGMNGSPVEVTTADSGSGTPSDPMIYTLNVANTNRLAAGIYTGFVKVTDERIPGTSTLGGETDTLVTTPDGIVLQWHNIPEFATYQAFPATVVIGCGPITGQIESPTCPVASATNGSSLNFTVSASSGNGGDPVVLYEVDYDYDGTTFDIDASNTTGVFTGVGPFIVPNPCDNNIPQTFKVAFRATDSCNPPNVTIFQTCDVTVDNCDLFVGDLSVIAINRGEGGEDPERITSLDLDWDDALGAVEYAIQKADGYNPASWATIDVAPISFYKWEPTGNDLDEDMRFRVIARAETGGNPLTDSDPSEEVFAMFYCNAGTISTHYWANYQENFEFRFVYWWGSSLTPDVDDWPPSAAKNFFGFFYWTPPAWTNSWAIIRSPQPVPDLVGQKRAFCDGYWKPLYPFAATMGMCVGTLSNPAPSGPTVSDFQIANTVYGSGTPYNRANTGVNSEFNTSNQDAWWFTFNMWTHVGYYLNDLCDNGDRDYVAYGWAIGPTSDVTWISGYQDGFVYVVD